MSPSTHVVHSPSGWKYQSVQENGDNVDCWDCGLPLNDDQIIVNDALDFAYHPWCLDEDSQV